MLPARVLHEHLGARDHDVGGRHPRPSPTAPAARGMRRTVRGTLPLACSAPRTPTSLGRGEVAGRREVVLPLLLAPPAWPGPPRPGGPPRCRPLRPQRRRSIEPSVTYRRPRTVFRSDWDRSFPETLSMRTSLPELVGGCRHRVDEQELTGRGRAPAVVVWACGWAACCLMMACSSAAIVALCCCDRLLVRGNLRLRLGGRLLVLLDLLLLLRQRPVPAS